MMEPHCDAPACDTWGGTDWLTVTHSSGRVVGTLCCLACVMTWAASRSQPTEGVGG